MATPQACELALHLLKHDFGTAVERVCRTTVELGPSTLNAIIKASGLTPLAVKHCLLILMKHNFVASFQNIPMRATKQRMTIVKFLYIAQPLQMLSVLKLPKWLLNVRNELSADAEAIIESLIEHGRLNQAHTIACAIDKLKGGKADIIDRSDEEMKSALQEEFAKLVSEHLVERAPMGMLPPPWFMNLDSSVKRGHKGLSNEFGEMVLTQSIAHTMFEENEKSRFSMAESDTMKQEDLQDRKMNGSRLNGHKDVKTEWEKITWRINAQEFNDRMKEKLFLDLILYSLDYESGELFRGLLKVYRLNRHKLSPNPEFLLLDDILKFVSTHEHLNTPEKVRKGLKALEEYPLTKIIAPLGDSEDGYTLNVKGLIRLLQLTSMDSIVEQKFGVHAKRIFRLMRRYQGLEERDISRKAMLPLKETREILYKLFLVNYVHMLDVPKEPSHTPSRTYYLWCIDQDLVLEKVRVDLYEKALKLLQRWEDEFSAVRDITARLEVDKNYEPSTEELKRMARVKSSCDALDGKLLHIDELISVFIL